MSKKAKTNFYFRKFDQSHNCIKKNWKIINSIFNNGKKQGDRIVLVNEDGRELCDSVDVSNEFCNYFSNIATKYDNEIPESRTDYLTYMPPANNRSFFITPATPIEIEKLIMSLSNKASNINIIMISI